MLLTWPPYRRINQQVQGNHQETITETCLTYLFIFSGFCVLPRQERNMKLIGRAEESYCKSSSLESFHKSLGRTNRVASFVFEEPQMVIRRSGELLVFQLHCCTSRHILRLNCCLWVLVCYKYLFKLKECFRVSCSLHVLLTKYNDFRKLLE